MPYMNSVKFGVFKLKEVKSLSRVWLFLVYVMPKRALCLTLCDPMDCSLPGSSVHGILEAGVLEWVTISFSRKSSRPRDWTQVSHIGQILCHLRHQGSQNRYQMRQPLLWGVKKGDLVWGCPVGSEVGFFLSSQNEWRLEYKNPWISGNVMLAVLFSAALNERFIHLFIHSKTIHWQCSRCQATF